MRFRNAGVKSSSDTECTVPCKEIMRKAKSSIVISANKNISQRIMMKTMTLTHPVHKIGMIYVEIAIYCTQNKNRNDHGYNRNKGLKFI